jgi:hypothetical protein
MTGVIVGKTNTGGTVWNSNGTGSFEVMGDANNAAAMTFYRPSYAINLGIDTDNVFRLGGWSFGAASRWSSDTGGNFVAYGDVTAYSDERNKKNWRDLPADFINQLATVKHGIYDRIDNELTQVGVSAQSLQKILEQAVLTSKDGTLSVAYGNTALVAAVELSKRVLELEKTIDRQQAQIIQINTTLESLIAKQSI